MINKFSILIKYKITRYLIVGAIGFVVDVGILIYINQFLGHGPYFSRLISFLFATLLTWGLHRYFTFDKTNNVKLHEYSKFLFTALIAMVASFILYWLLLQAPITPINHPVVAVSVSSLLVLFLNFSLNKKFVFSEG